MSTLNDINITSDQIDSSCDKTTDQYHSPNGNLTSIDGIDTLNANTPTNVTIAEMDTDDVPIRFCVYNIFYNVLNHYFNCIG